MGLVVTAAAAPADATSPTPTSAFAKGSSYLPGFDTSSDQAKSEWFFGRARSQAGLTPFFRSGGSGSRPVARGCGQGDWSDHVE
ncbi:hypothetical protein, partial [Propionibacterium freudenreichii]